MSHRSPETAFKPLSGLDSVTIASATTTAGTAIDTLGWKHCTFVVSVGTVAGTTTGVSALIQSDDNSSFTSATSVTGAAFTAATLLAGDAIEAGRLNCHETERYLRVSVTTAGASPSVPISVFVMLSGHDDDDRQDVTYAFTV